MPTPITILFGGDADGRDDFASLQRAAAGNKSVEWSALKSTRKGDRILIYCRKPHGALVAVAEAKADPRPGECWSYETKLRNIRMITPPIAREVLQREFPSWPWAKSTRGQAKVPQEFCDRLWMMTMGTDNLTTERAVPAQGAGFGNASHNPLVEAAAVAFVRRYLKDRGFTVKSREAEKVGYDLDASKRRTVLHVEVKGVSGALVQFLITSAEVRMAREDPAFRLMVVTGARSAAARIHVFTGAEFVNEFELTSLAYMARRK